jgi:type IV pilus assembly protein PilV
MRALPRPSLFAHQSGVTLIEVLVSMLIMALGMVSMAALQTFTLKYQMGSVQRAQLSGLLSDYTERVRSNLRQAPGQLASSPYLLSEKWEGQATSQPPSPAKDCATEACQAAELAAFDMAQWRARVRNELPQGSVRVDAAGNNGMTVTFMWSDKVRQADAVVAERTSNICTNTMTGLDQQACCPAAVAAPEGVRCARFEVLP